MKRTVEFKYRSFGRGLEAIGSEFPIRLQLRSDLHLARKFWHLSMGGVIAGIYHSGLATGLALLILSILLAVTLVMEAVRLRNSTMNQLMIKIWGPVMRSCEVNRCTGIPFYLASSMVAIAAFPRPIAVLGILFLACGDPIASLIGILYGKKSIRFANGKSLLGTLAGVVTCAVVAFVYLRSLSFSPAHALLLSAVGGFAGGTAEMIPLDMDDNFTIPVISGFLMWFACILLGV